MSTKVKHKERSHRSYRKDQELRGSFNRHRFWKTTVQNQKSAVNSFLGMFFNNRTKNQRESGADR